MKNPIKSTVEYLAGTADVPTAQAKAVQCRQTVIEAGAAVEQARVARGAADETGDPAAIQTAEAGLVAAERAADRATRGLEVAERRLEQANEAANAAARKERAHKLRHAIERHGKAAQSAAAAVAALAEALADMDKADAVIAEAQRAGIGSSNAVAGHNYGSAASRRRVELALRHAGILAGGLLHEPESLDVWSASLGRLLVAE